jgi:two-component system, NarL family, response regulator NreC
LSRTGDCQMVHGVLIVDDHEPLRRRIRYALEGGGLDVCGEATDGSEAIQKVKERSPGVVILNISMPIMSGFEALPEIIRCSPNTRVVMFTLDDAQELRQKAFHLGASGYVTKSAPIEELLAEVRKLLVETL